MHRRCLIYCLRELSIYLNNNFSYRMVSAKLVFVFCLMALVVSGRGKHCAPSSCGNLSITPPFRLGTDPAICGACELACENNRATLVTKVGKFFVENISHVNHTIRVVDATLDMNKCSIPQSSLLDNNHGVLLWNITIYVLKCNIPVNSSLYVDASECANSNSSLHTYFFLFNKEAQYSDFNESCIVQAQFPFSLSNNITNLSAHDIYRQLLTGFELKTRWFYGNYYLMSNEEGNTMYEVTFISKVITVITGAIMFVRCLLGVPILLAIIVYRFRRRHLSGDDAIEEFLQKQISYMPIRYTYLEIKTMTGSFKDKLGQGGYGSVFKGKLRSGNFVAVKLLTMSKGNGQDFINEVATMGRIHHANVMRLIGFCVEGSKQALVYDFMPNGSLDKIIFSDASDRPLNWRKMFEIALGVARGIEYLHNGCEMQILHFDIKPHNILLDENFNPKVSDFGLAKLFPVDDSIVCLTAVRGTIGYMAPELFYKNIGGISYKADVYSFGMLLMEMVGRRRDISALLDQSSSSQTFFPTWIHGQLDRDEDFAVVLGDISDDERKIVKKIVIVALWCIQMKPAFRPSMRKVLEMLEKELQLLEMPPKPCFSPTAAALTADYEGLLKF